MSSKCKQYLTLCFHDAVLIFIIFTASTPLVLLLCLLEEKARWQGLDGEVNADLQSAIKALKSLDPADVEPFPEAKDVKVDETDGGPKAGTEAEAEADKGTKNKHSFSYLSLNAYDLL